VNQLKKVWGWVRGHWLFVVLGVVALAAMPAGLVVSGMQTAAVREKVQKDVQTQYDSINKAKVTYALMSPTGEKVLEKNTEVRSVLTSWYKEQWQAVQAKTGTLGAKGLEFNKADHQPLLADLFPQPPELERQTRPREMARAFIDLHPKLLATVNSGLPPAPAEVAATLEDYQRSVMDQARLGGQTELGADQRERLSKELVELRLQRYRARSQDLGVYAALGIFQGVPSEVPKEDVSLAQCWEWQELAWAHADILRGIAKANGLAEGGSSGGGVPSAVVKRILRIDATPGASIAAAGGRDGGGGGWGGGGGSGGQTTFTEPTPQPFKPGADKAPEDFTKSITGRVGGYDTENKWYDIRPVVLELIVSSQRLPSFIDALAATNFMTVTSVQLEAVDPMEHLKNGFYYGDEHVVHAVMKVETIWLREWRKPWMPRLVQEARGMFNPDAQATGEPGAGDGAAPPPPEPDGGGRPPRRPPGGD
jgi:hypothetical protein